MTDPFSIESFKFPEGFIFGSATSGHQIEGDNVYSNNWAEELKQHEINPEFEVSGKACNSYVMWKDDVELIGKLGHRAYRMSVEWSRIEPSEGEFKQDEIEHYVKIFEALKQKGIKICISLTHGTVPNWFFEKGWFYKYENVKYFERYLNRIVPRFKDYADWWITLNEPNGGVNPEYFDFKFNAVRYHARANSIIKQYSDKPVSLALMFVQQFGKRQWDKFDVAVQNYFDVVQNEFFLHAIRTGELVLPYRDAVYDKEIKNSCDFWAINSYQRKMIDTRKADFAGTRYRHEKTQLLKKGNFGNTFNAECLIHNLTRLTDKPVIITENGSATDDDDFRIIYILEYLSAVKEAIDMGVDVRGYFYWSLIDNYEWSSFVPKFGLASVDRENGFKRTPKRSAEFYKKIIENNGYEPYMLKDFLTEQPKVKYGTESFAPSPTIKNGKNKIYLGEL